MSTIHLSASANAQILAAQAGQAPATPDAKPALMLEIKPTGRFDFSYTQVRMDTGEAIWRWPLSSPLSGVGQLIDLRV